MNTIPTILTGDRPTGQLHPGHYVGSLRQRVQLQHDHRQFILMADLQGLTDNGSDPQKRRFVCNPRHLRIADPGQSEGNVVFTYLDAFHQDNSLIADMKAHYQRGGLGDRQCKNELEDCLQTLLAPIRERRATIIADKGMLLELLRQGSERAHHLTQQTLHEVKRGLGLPVLF